MDRAVDHSAAPTAISYLRTRAVYDTIFIVITILGTKVNPKYDPHDEKQMLNYSY